jgi:P-type E1-E2 ATPase
MPNTHPLLILTGAVAMPTVLSVTLAIGEWQHTKDKAIVTCITAIEELTGVTILCSDKTGTLITNELAIDRPTIHTHLQSSLPILLILRTKMQWIHMSSLLSVILLAPTLEL